MKRDWRPQQQIDSEHATVKRVVQEHFGVSDRDMYSKTRREPVVTARQVVCYLLRRFGYGVCAIGRSVGYHHTGVIHAVQSIEDEMSVYPACRTVVETLSARCLRELGGAEKIVRVA